MLIRNSIICVLMRVVMFFFVFHDLRKALEKMKQILEESNTNKRDNQVSVLLANDDLLTVELKGKNNQ